MKEINEAIAEFLKRGFKKATVNYKEQEKIRKEFVSNYSVSNIINFSLDDYVLGKGSENKSFCYWIETILKDYGDMHGARADKFGIYFGVEEQKYITTLIWSRSLNIEEAFANIKKEIVTLIGAGANNDYETIKSLKISPMFKSKILSMYYPEKYMCIYSPEHILHFYRILGLEEDRKLSIIEKSVELVKFKYSNEITRNWDNFTFQKFLYFWKDPRNVENTFDEEQFENYLNATDVDAGYIYSEKLVKARKINQKILNNLKIEYNDCCQICGKAFEEKYGVSVVEGHHIEYFSKSENNDANNIILLCPNHHRMIHKLNPIFDRGLLIFKYKNGYEDKILLDKHLKS